MKRFIGGLFLLTSALFAAQDPVQWTLTFDSKSAAPGSKILGHLTAKMEAGWHLYSLTTPRPPIATTVALADSPVVAGVKVYQPKPLVKLDPSFNVNTETFGEEVIFLLEIELKKDSPAGSADLTANVRYQCCNDTMCLPPKKKTATATIAIDPAAKTQAIVIPAGYTEFKKEASAATAASTESTSPKPAAPPPSSDFGLYLLAFGGGLATIFTPCVFPMIPFTVSYFVNQRSGKRGGIIQAVIFCAGIVVFFTGLGLLTKTIAGPFGVVQLGNSPWVNLFIALVFVVFGFSLLGAFELTLPSGLLTKLNQASDRGGYVGALIMGLTFTLTSFACIGPIVGPILVSSVQASGLQPVIRMASFASGLALPFFVLALFPSFLQKLPKSGGWLMRVKVVLGFIVLAVSVKYLSTADQVLQKNWISHEMFVACWIVLFAMAGLYLLGFLHLEGIKPDEHLGIGRMLIGALFLIFSLSLVPGLFGIPLGEIDALIPVQAKTASFGGGASTGGAPEWMRDQYKEALAKARAENKLVFINFTGHACTNCHWMKQNMFPRPEVASLLKDFVLLDLFTDGTDQASEENQQLEEKRFGTVALPYYAIIDPDEKTIATFPGLTKNTQEFVTFLKSGTQTKTSATL